jgi:hypothetical protein
MSLVKRLLVFSLVITTVLWSFGGLTVKAEGSYGAGSLLAKEGVEGAAVYYIGSDGAKYVFPDSKTYFTWYTDFSDVVRVPVTELDMYDNGGAVTYRPGTYLVTHEDTANVYAVGAGGVYHLIPSEAEAIDMYGEDWGAMIMDVIPGYFSTSYTEGADLSTTYPTGTLLTDGTDTYYVDGATKRIFADADAFEANNLDWDDVLTVDDLSGYTDGESVTGEETGIAGFMPSEDDGEVVIVDGDLTVTLYNSPEATSLPTGSPNEFLGLKLSAGGSAVSVESITITSYGLGTSTEIDDVTIYNNGVKVGSSNNINSDREATFNFSTPIDVAAGGSVVLMVKATLVGASASETYALGIAEAADVVTGGSVGGSYPLQGNLMEAVSASIGTVTIGSITDDTSTVNFGEDNVLLGDFSVTAGSEEPLLWETARFRNGGTNNSDVVANLRIEVDGDVVDEGVSLDGKYVNFDMGNLLVEKSNSVAVEIYGDIGVASVGNTVDLYIDNAADFIFMGQTYGYGVQISSIASYDAAGEGITATLAAADFTIDMDKSATPSKDVKGGDENVVLATISLTSNGENATVNDITDTSGSDGDFYIQGTGLTITEADNFELRDVDSGVLYDITETVSTTLAGWTLAMADEISLTAGVTKTFELRVDLAGANDSTPIDDGDTLKVYLEDGAMNITGDESDATITDITPSSVSGATATVRDGSLNVTTIALTNKSVVGGAGIVDPIIIYKAGLEVGDSSDLTLTAYRVDVDGTYFAAFTDDNVAQLDLYVVEDGVERLLKSTSNKITNDSLATAYINFTSLNSTNRVLTAGKDVEVIVKAVFASSLPTTGQFALEAVDTASYIVAKDSDNTDITETLANALTDSRLMTLASTGTLKAELKVTDTMANDDHYILAGSETAHGRYLAELVFTTANEAIELTDIALEEYEDSTGADVKVVKLYDEDGTVVAYKSPTAAGHVHFEEADFLSDANVLAADESTSFFVGVLTKSINADGDAEGTATFDHGIRYSFATTTGLAAFVDLSTDESVKAKGVDSGEDITIVENPSGTVGTGEYAWADTKTKTASTTGSILTVITNDMDNGTLAGGNNKIVGQYKFLFDNGSNRTSENQELKAQLRELIVNIATSSGVLASNVQVYIEGDSSNMTDAVQPDSNNEATADLTTLDTDTNLVDGEVVLIVIADLSVTGSDQYIQTELADLTTDFTYNGNDNDGTTYWVNARLDGVSQVTGGTLSN